MKNKILVAGGAGYIGSHTCIALHNVGYEIVVYDNLFNSSREAINHVSKLTGQPIKFIEEDCASCYVNADKEKALLR